MITISPMMNPSITKYIPNINHLGDFDVKNNLVYILRDPESDQTDCDAIEIIRRDHELFQMIQEQMKNNHYPFFDSIRIYDRPMICSVGLVGDIDSIVWSYISYFEVISKLWIGDPCYVKTGLYSYSKDMKDVFYAFCNIGDPILGGYITDVVLINAQMMNEYSLNNKNDICLFDNPDTPKTTISVDSGCIICCDAFDIVLDDAYVSNCYQVGVLNTIEGIISNSGFGDGEYDIYEYNDSNKHHYAYLINFIN